MKRMSFIFALIAVAVVIGLWLLSSVQTSPSSADVASTAPKVAVRAARAVQPLPANPDQLDLVFAAERALAEKNVDAVIVDLQPTDDGGVKAVVRCRIGEAKIVSYTVGKDGHLLKPDDEGCQ